MSENGWMKRKGWSLMGPALVVVLAGCYEHTYVVGAGAPRGRVVYDEWHDHWLGGLIDPGKELELRRLCPSGNATIHEEVTFLNGLVGALTGEIYAPTTVTVRCRRGRRAQMELSAEEVRQIVTSPEFLEWVAAVAPMLLEDAAEAQLALD